MDGGLTSAAVLCRLLLGCDLDFHQGFTLPRRADRDGVAPAVGTTSGSSERQQLSGCKVRSEHATYARKMLRLNL